jgi:hypothetical protein
MVRANTLHGGDEFLTNRLSIRRQLCAESAERRRENKCAAQKRFAERRHGDIMVVAWRCGV